MSDQHEWRRPGHFIAFAVLAVLFLVAVSFVFLWLFTPRPYPGYYFPLFPFGLFWTLLLVLFVFGILRWAF